MSSGPSTSRNGCSREERVLLTDTTMRDAHQSLLATRMRTIDMVAIAPAYAALLPQLFSVECWGGATFDVAMRFLQGGSLGAARAAARGDAQPAAADAAALRQRRRLHQLSRQRRALLRRSRPPQAGIDVFRDLRLAELGREHARRDRRRARERAAVRGGDLLHRATSAIRARRKYTLDYYVKLGARAQARRHARARHQGHGRAVPARAPRYELVKALKDETGLPVHFHTHDTSGIAAASVLAAIAAGADAVDGGDRCHERPDLAAEPGLDRRGAALRPRDPGIDTEQPAQPVAATGSRCAAATRRSRATSAPAPPRSTCTACPAGSTPICASRRARSASRMHAGRKWPRPTPTSTRMFGDIVKVTPTSKVVGDMALLMVTSGLTATGVLDPDTEIAFPESVVQLFRGDLGQPYGGFPPGSAAQGPQGRRAAHRAARRDSAAGRSRSRARRGQRASRRGRSPTSDSPRI